EELSAALHLERRTRVMRQDENRRVVRRLIAPPALPVLIRPRSTHGPEHVASHDPRADVLEALRRKIVVDAGLAIRVAMHLVPRARFEKPVEQFRPRDS